MIWAKSGFRSHYYANLTWSDNDTLERIVSVDDQRRERKRIASAKCHALKAYKTAIVHLNNEYIRDADVSNQKTSLLLEEGGLPDFVTPKQVYRGTQDSQIRTIIHQFEEYFPAVELIRDVCDREDYTFCPCNQNKEVNGVFEPRIRAMTKTILSDDTCDVNFALPDIRSLMTHLHQNNTPIHSAAFAYLAFLSGDRLPDFGYAFNFHSDIGKVECCCPDGVPCDMEMFCNKIKAFKEMEDKRVQKQKIEDDQREAFAKRLRMKYEKLGPIPNGFICHVLNRD
jgi:hypothetical protein